MNATDLCFTPATDLAKAIRAKQLSPVEVMDAVLTRVDAVNPKLNAIVTLTADTARERAKAAEAAQMKGDWWGPLHGVPFSVKDLDDTAGVPTRMGSKAYADNVPTKSAVHVLRMEAAGAISIGKTATPEFGWKALTDSPLTGMSHNPWHLGHNPGGSSGGSAACVAAGLGPLATASDGGGSIRIPASFCGIFGIKPSYGRVPLAGPNPHNHAHLGPVARTVTDAALMLSVTAGPNDRDQFSLEGAPADYLGQLDAGIKGCKAAWSADLGFVKNLDPEVRAACESAARAFSSLGASVTDDGPDLTGIMDLAESNWKAAMAMRIFETIPDYADQVDPGLLACAEEGRDLSAGVYLHGKFTQYKYWTALHTWFENYDLLLTPTVAVPALPVGKLLPDGWPDHAWNWLVWAPYSSPFNLLHLPAATVPVGFTKTGLPIGLQIVGRRFADLQVLQAARAFEQAHPWAQHRPQL